MFPLEVKVYFEEHPIECFKCKKNNLYPQFWGVKEGCSYFVIKCYNACGFEEFAGIDALEDVEKFKKRMYEKFTNK